VSSVGVLLEKDAGVRGCRDNFWHQSTSLNVEEATSGCIYMNYSLGGPTPAAKSTPAQKLNTLPFAVLSEPQES
jgi:hypothetical protein